jgi:hypothetical protein
MEAKLEPGSTRRGAPSPQPELLRKLARTNYFLFLKYRLIRRIRSSLLNIAASQLALGEDTPPDVSAAAQETAAPLSRSWIDRAREAKPTAQQTRLAFRGMR